MILMRWHCPSCGDQVLVMVDRDGNVTCMSCDGPVGEPDAVPSVERTCDDAVESAR